MPAELSKATHYWLEKREVWLAAEERFRHEWGDILTEVRRGMSRKGWVVRTDTDEPYEEIKLLRRHWPGGMTGIHYEIRAFDRYRRLGIADLSLHIEESVPDQEVVCKRIRQLLHRHSESLIALLADCAPSLPDEPVQDIIKGRLPLVDVTTDKVLATIDKMTETESFVDEALFLGGKTPLWRTDFFVNDARPSIEWTESFGSDKYGGWEFMPSGGRLSSPHLRCRGNKCNYRDNRNILVLNAGTPFFGLCAGQHIGVCVVLRASQSGRMDFCMQASKEGDWQTAYEETKRFEGVDRWQVATWQGQIGEFKSYDSEKQGLYAYLIAGPMATDIAIDSIEIQIS